LFAGAIGAGDHEPMQHGEKHRAFHRGLGAVANCVEIRSDVVPEWVMISCQAARSMH
jgi:hypothetical protein